LHPRLSRHRLRSLPSPASLALRCTSSSRTMTTGRAGSAAGTGSARKHKKGPLPAALTVARRGPFVFSDPNSSPVPELGFGELVCSTRLIVPAQQTWAVCVIHQGRVRVVAQQADTLKVHAEPLV